VLDSQKPAEPTPPRDGAPIPDQPAQPAQPADQAAQPAPAPAAPPPTNDSAAQQQLQPVQVQPVTEEKGTRVERELDVRRRERPEGVEVVREVGDRVIIQLGDQIFVDSNDRPRMARGAREVYYEDLPRGRTRETIVRENGVQVVTIRNRYGDVIRRSRITEDGNEYVLSYVDESAYAERGEWRDPGDELPPMRLTIPVEDYILDAGLVEDDDRYYDFLDEPPVEQVERLYSVDEVKRSARVRDKTRRIDLDTVTFEFGSATIVESEIPRLEGVAAAMEKLLEKNPAETFLIEGHTDAVGADVANLALSDRRAEAVADALTNVFAIPPENLTTQGYGERYLKVRTEEPEQANRRVAIRRITALVSPVASAN
jgi:outer membrane protein OmpA-like peptidoglycan-associated protein